MFRKNDLVWFRTADGYYPGIVVGPASSLISDLYQITYERCGETFFTIRESDDIVGRIS